MCYETLEIRDVAPCDDCGWLPEELEHFQNQEHTYGEFEVYGTKLVLCNFCEVDFSSDDPKYWGLPPRSRVGYGSEGFRKLSEIPSSKLAISKSFFCQHCRLRLTMIEAVMKARKKNVT